MLRARPSHFISSGSASPRCSGSTAMRALASGVVPFDGFLEATEFPNVAAVVKGADLAAFGPMNASSPNMLINEWQQRICACLVFELGKKLKLAFSDTTIVLVESAELAGFKSKNIVGSLLDRIRLKVEDTELQKPQHRDPFQLLKRHLQSDETNAWVLIDDIDATFVTSPEAAMQISTFFSACRRLTTDVGKLAIRTSVRSVVWTVIKRTDEALDKCEQYILDIMWSNDEARRILENKIHAYIRRSHSLPRWVRNTSHDRTLGLVFRTRVPWGSNEVSVDRPIHIMSAGRPRWAAQLCKMAAENAHRDHLTRVGIKQITGVLRDFGRFRPDDLYREHGHQYPQLQRLTESFAGGSSRYSSTQLLDHIRRRLSNHSAFQRLTENLLTMAH
jgi:hypothetical protein